MNKSTARRDFARSVLADVAPNEVPLFEDYANAADNIQDGKGLGSDLGLVEVAAVVGPIAVWVAQKIFDQLLDWAGDLAKKTAEGFLVDQGKAKLKQWLTAPEKGGLQGTLTAKGRIEILAEISRLCAAAKLPPDEAALLTQRVAVRLFGNEQDRD